MRTNIQINPFLVFAIKFDLKPGHYFLLDKIASAMKWIIRIISNRTKSIICLIHLHLIWKGETTFKADISQSVVEYFLKVDIVFWSGCTWLYGWSGAVRHQAPVSCHLPIIITKQASLQYHDYIMTILSSLSSQAANLPFDGKENLKLSQCTME